MARFKAKITYSIDKGHLYYNCYLPDERNGTLEHSSAYVMNEDYFNGYEEMIEYIIDDLLSIVGGEHNSDHVHHVNFEIEEV